MNLLKRRSRKSAEVKELDLAPMLSLMVSLIPMILLSVSFYKVQSFDSSIFVQESSQKETKEGLKETPSAFLTVSNNRNATILIKTSKKVLKKFNINDSAGQISYDKLEKTFKHIKHDWPMIVSLKVNPQSNVSYDELIAVFDLGKKVDTENKAPLFKDVSLTGIL